MFGRLQKKYQKEENKYSKVHNGLEFESVVDFILLYQSYTLFPQHYNLIFFIST